MDEKIALGDEAKDIVTGFRGLVIGRIEHLFRSPELRIQPRELKENGEPSDAQWFEEQQVEKC